MSTNFDIFIFTTELLFWSMAIYNAYISLFVFVWQIQLVRYLLTKKCRSGIIKIIIKCVSTYWVNGRRDWYGYGQEKTV